MSGRAARHGYREILPGLDLALGVIESLRASVEMDLDESEPPDPYTLGRRDALESCRQEIRKLRDEAKGGSAL